MNLDSLARAGFRGPNRALAWRAAEALAAEQPMTLRQLYYRLVSAGVLANAQPEYKRLGSVMTRLREAGAVPRVWLVDHVRATLKPSSWSGLADFGEAVRHSYRLDFWARMPHHLEVLVEKDAVAGTLQPVTEEYDVRLRVCRGYASVSFAGEIADLWARIPKPVFAYYLGDFDPSGFDLERDLRAKLERYSGRRWCGAGGPDRRSFHWERLAVCREDFDRYGLVRLPVKTRDRRSAGFRREHGEDCAELDALPPAELRRRVEAAIYSHIDPVQWERLQQVEETERRSLEEFLERWPGPAGANGRP